MTELDPTAIWHMRDVLYNGPGRMSLTTDQGRALLAERDRLAAELDRLHSWDGLMALLDEHWPADIFPTIPYEEGRNPGPRIVALLRVRDRLTVEVDTLRGQVQRALAECDRLGPQAMVGTICAALAGESAADRPTSP